MAEYTVIKELGKGSFGKVMLVTDGSGKQLVMKTIDLSECTNRDRKGADLEVKLLSTLRHPNIVRYKGCKETDAGVLEIYMECCSGGDLYRYIKKRNGQLLEEPQALDWFVQMCMALQYLHERNVLHRDLKTQNVFLTKNNVIKLGDFGIARILDSNMDMATTLIGTPYYMSPEIFANLPYNHKSDVWALGCCLYELCTLRHAFNATDLSSLMYKVITGKFPPIDPSYSVPITKILKACLHVNPDKRPSASKILSHAFIKEHILSFLKNTGLSLNCTPSTCTLDQQQSRAGSARPGTSAGAVLHDRVNRPKSSDHAVVQATTMRQTSRQKSATDSVRSSTPAQVRKRKKSLLREKSKDSIDSASFLDSTSSTSNNRERACSAPNSVDRPVRPGSVSGKNRGSASANAAINDELKNDSAPRTSSALMKTAKLERDLEGVVRAMSHTLNLQQPVLSAEQLAVPRQRQEDERSPRDRRASAIKRQCTVRMSKRTLQKAFEYMDKYEGPDLERELRKLLNADYEKYAPLLVQLRMYESTAKDKSNKKVQESSK